MVWGMFSTPRVSGFALYPRLLIRFACSCFARSTPFLITHSTAHSPHPILRIPHYAPLITHPSLRITHSALHIPHFLLDFFCFFFHFSIFILNFVKMMAHDIEMSEIVIITSLEYNKKTLCFSFNREPEKFSI